jgi:hypothetical protein
MITIDVHGGTKIKQDTAYRCVKWFLENQEPDIDDMHVEVHIRSCYKRDGVFGWCERVESDEYKIDVDKDCRLFEFVQTMMHEMTHLVQYYYDDPISEEMASSIEKELAIKCFVECL